MCSIKVCSLQVFVCYLSHGIRITRSGEICQNNVETQCQCLEYAQSVRHGSAFIVFGNKAFAGHKKMQGL